MPGLAAAIKGMEKTFKKSNPDIVFDPNRKVEFIPTNCLAFDLVVGGGFPRGRITEVFGMEHSGKSSLMYSALAGVQKAGGVAVMLDFEHAFDPVYAEEVFGLKIDGETFALFEPNCIEEGDAIMEYLKQIDNIDLIVCDSVDAMKPKAIIEASLDKERRVGAQAQAISRFLARAKSWIKDKNCALAFVNQMRVSINTSKFEQNIGTGAGFNPMETHTTPGGYSVRFYSSLRVKLEYGGRQEDEAGENMISGEAEKTRIGQMVKIINIKNKVATPFLKGLAHFDFVMPDQKGGWRADKDAMLILKKRGRIRQQATKFVYEGLNEEWTNVASKKDSEAKFMADPKLMADAQALVVSLISRKGERLLEMAEIGKDFDDVEVAESKSAAMQEAGGELSLAALAGGEKLSDEDVAPVGEITLD